MILPRKLLGLIYLAIGIFVAYSKDYLENVETLKRVISAALAILLWPLLLIGVDLHIKYLRASGARRDPSSRATANVALASWR